MPPVEQNAVPLSVSALQSGSELKVVDKARQLPVVSDSIQEIGKIAQTVSSQLSENASVQTAKQYVETGLKSLAATETFSNIQGRVKELSEHERVGSTLSTVKASVATATEQLDDLAAEKLDSLTAAVPALRASTPELVDTTKEAAHCYLSLATEYLASFGLAQVSLKIADKSLSLAEKTTAFFQPDSEDEASSSGSRLVTAHQQLKRLHRAVRAVKRAGMRKSALEQDPVARTGIVGSIFSLFSVNSVLKLVGLQVEPTVKSPLPEKTVKADSDDTEDAVSIDEEGEHERNLSFLKGDVELGSSDEGSDYVPSEAEDSSSDDAESESEVDEEEGEEGESDDEVENKPVKDKVAGFESKIQASKLPAEVVSKSEAEDESEDESEDDKEVNEYEEVAKEDFEAAKEDEIGNLAHEVSEGVLREVIDNELE
uniref:T-complex protein 1 subunit eta n=1 Tax=Acartia pacifica TaxID=335913 RepID=A0A0U2LFI7_ACAPC|nr:T-complex protein 1 subunit eta [Acartia pacifica]